MYVYTYNVKKVAYKKTNAHKFLTSILLELLYLIYTINSIVYICNYLYIVVQYYISL